MPPRPRQPHRDCGHRHDDRGRSGRGAAGSGCGERRRERERAGGHRDGDKGEGGGAASSGRCPHAAQRERQGADVPRPTDAAAATDGGGPHRPAIRTFDGDGSWTAVVELPGVAADGVTLTAGEGELIVAASRGGDDDDAPPWASVTYEGRVRLPEGADDTGVEATCANGLLTIRLPLPAAPQGRTIEVKPG